MMHVCMYDRTVEVELCEEQREQNRGKDEKSRVGGHRDGVCYTALYEGLPLVNKYLPLS